MFVVDTNVVSELMRYVPSEAVLGWMGRHPDSALFTTTICEAEVLFDLRIMADGRRRQGLPDVALKVFSEDFRDRVLPFDRPAASAYAEVRADVRRQGVDRHQRLTLGRCFVSVTCDADRHRDPAPLHSLSS